MSPALGLAVARQCTVALSCEGKNQGVGAGVWTRLGKRKMKPEDKEIKTEVGEIKFEDGEVKPRGQNTESRGRRYKTEQRRQRSNTQRTEK